MDPDAIAPMLVMITLILTTGGVLVLRPLSKQLAAYLQMLTQQKQSPALEQELARARELAATLENRLALLEERQNFAESLLAARGQPQVAPGQSAPPQALVLPEIPRMGPTPG